MSQTPLSPFQDWLKNRYHLGYFIVGVASLIGGIFIFAFIVIPSLESDTGVPREMQMIFTDVYSRQGLLFNERKKYSPAQIEVGIDQETCRQYSCLLTVDPDGRDYVFKLSKGDQTWAIHSRSPVPKEVP